MVCGDVVLRVPCATYFALSRGEHSRAVGAAGGCTTIPLSSVLANDGSWSWLTRVIQLVSYFIKLIVNHLVGGPPYLNKKF